MTIITRMRTRMRMKRMGVESASSSVVWFLEIHGCLQNMVLSLPPNANEEFGLVPTNVDV
jgi:hypothetical protein